MDLLNIGVKIWPDLSQVMGKKMVKVYPLSPNEDCMEDGPSLVLIFDDGSAIRIYAWNSGCENGLCANGEYPVHISIENYNT